MEIQALCRSKLISGYNGMPLRIKDYTDPELNLAGKTTFRIKVHPDSFRLGIQSIDPFQGFYIPDLLKTSIGRCDTYIIVCGWIKKHEIALKEII